MADIKISQLPVASSVSDADIVVINQGGSTKTATRSLIRGTQNAGTVTSITAGTGLTGGTITESGTIALSSPVAVSNGGTGVAISSGANSVVLRDASQNISVNSVIESFSTITASGTQVVLTVESAPNYLVTGSGGQTIKLPDATTLQNGVVFLFNNNQSSGAISVNNNSSTLVASIPSGGFSAVSLLSNAVAAGSWERHEQAPSNVSWSTNTLDYPGSITSATWNGNAVAVNRGGTGAATLTGIVKGNGTATMTAATPGTDYVVPSGNITGTAGNITGIAAIANGGTGATSAPTARTALGAAASGVNTDITSVALTTGTVSTTPSAATDIANKAYADSIGSGINFHDAADYATLAVLSPAATYNQPGGAGVGVNATLTGSTNVPLVVDGITVATGKRILVKNQGSAFQNGIYTVTQQGDNATVPYILTRASDYDTSGTGINEVQAGDFVLVLNSTLANTAWVQQTPAPINFGVTAINFTQFAAAASGVATFSADNTGFTPATATNGTVTLGGTLNVAHGGTNQTSFTDGQILIGNTTGNTLAKSTLTAGTGMTVTNGSGAITLTANGLGTQVKTVGIDASTIQGCIDLCTSASAGNPFTVLIPPKAGNYVENLTLKGSVALVGLTNALNSDAIQIEGSHTYTPDAALAANSNRIGFQNFTFISASLTANTISVVAGSGGLKYASQLRFVGCVFSGGKNSGVSHISTCDNVSLYIDNCRFESTTGNAASNGILQGNGPLYLSNNVLFDVFGRAIDVPTSTTLTKTATSTLGSFLLTVSDTTGLSVGQKISGTGLYSTTTITAIGSGTVTMSSTPQTPAAGFTATFGQTPYVEIHDSVLIGKGAEVVRLGNGLLTCNGSNFTNTASGGSGINMLTGYAAAVGGIPAKSTTVGIVNSSFAISDTSAYTITGAVPLVFAALNGISYSNGVSGVSFSILINSNVTVYDYTARATSIENGGTGATTQQAAINALSGAVTANQVLAGNGTNITLRALAAADIPNLDTGKLTTGTLPVTRGGTGAATLTGLVKGTGTTAMVAAVAGTDYQAPIGTISGIAKGNGANALTAAVAGTDYQAPIGTISGIAKGNGANALTAAAAADVATVLGSQTAATVYAAPAGAAGTAQFRALTTTDIPGLDAAKITSGTLATLRGGTGTTAGITGINTTQIASLTTAQTASFIPQLTTAGLLSLAQMPVIPAVNGGTGTTAGITAITTTQLGCLTTGQVANLVPQLNSSGQIYTSQIATLNQNTTGTAANLSGSQTAATVYAAPAASAGTAQFRTLVAGDIPALNNTNITTTVSTAKTAAYTLVLTDVNTFIPMNLSAAANLTIPLNSSVAFPIGTQVLVQQTGSAANQVTVVATSGVTLQSAGAKVKTNTQYSVITLIKVATDTWTLAGDIV